MSKIYAVKCGEEWFIARRVQAQRYARPSETLPGKVWSEVRTTAWICRVGEEAAAIKLPEKA